MKPIPRLPMLAALGPDHDLFDVYLGVRLQR
jgi:hypothetical protein